MHRLDNGQTMEAFRLDPDTGQWSAVPWDVWSAFKLKGAPIAGLSGSVHFVVVVADNTGIWNLIADRYDLDQEGRALPNNVLSHAEQKRWDEIYLATEHTEADRLELKGMQDRLRPTLVPSRDDILTLLLQIDRPLHPSGGARHLVAEAGVDVSKLHRRPLSNRPAS